MSRSADAEGVGAPGGQDPPDGGDPLGRMEGAVDRLLAEVNRLRRRNRAAEERTQEVEELLRRFTKGAEDPARLHKRIRGLETENEELRRRLEEGRASVERLQARIRFLEDHR